MVPPLQRGSPAQRARISCARRVHREKIKPSGCVRYLRGDNNVSFEEDGIDFGSKDFDGIRVHETLRDFGLGIVVPAEDDQADIGFVQPARLGGEEASGVHRILFVVAEIAGQQRRINPLVETKINQTDEGLPDYVANQLREFRKASHRGPEERVGMDAGLWWEPKVGCLPRRF